MTPEGAQFGKDRRSDELPAELARRESRLAKLHEAKQAQEDEAAQSSRAGSPKPKA
jgi:hypothetical protein